MVTSRLAVSLDFRPFFSQRIVKIEELSELSIEELSELSFLGILAKNGQFWTVFGQNGRNGIFFQKSAWNIFSAFTSPNQLQFSEKSNEGIPRNRVADKRTNGRTRAKFKVLTNSSTNHKYYNNDIYHTSLLISNVPQVVATEHMERRSR